MKATSSPIEPGSTFEANKSFTMQGVDYKRGDLVDTSRLPEYKIGQFLNQRLIRPVRSVAPTPPE